MTRTILAAWLAFLTIYCSASASTVTEHLKTMPDSICPLATVVAPDTVTDNYLHIRLSDVSDLEVRTLACEGTDTLLCVIQTFKAPLAESDIRIYDTEWKERQRLTFNLTDILGADDAIRLRKFFDPLFISAHLSADTEELQLSLSYTNLSDDEKKELKGARLQTSLKWNGETFK